MKNILEKNELIAKFIGVELLKDLLASKNGFINIDIDIYEQCKFHSDWNWLMKVVDKIERLLLNDDNSFNVTIGATNYCVIQDSYGEIYEDIEISGETKLLTVYKAVIKFIKWYNKQNKTNNNGKENNYIRTI